MIALIGSRVLAALVLLVVLSAIYTVLPDQLPLIGAVSLVLLPFVQWAAVWFFGRRALEEPEIVSLRVRTQDAVALALGQTMAAVLGLIVVGRALELVPPVDRGVFLVGLLFALFMVAAPAFNWFVTYRPWRSS